MLHSEVVPTTHSGRQRVECCTGGQRGRNSFPVISQPPPPLTTISRVASDTTATGVLMKSPSISGIDLAVELMRRLSGEFINRVSYRWAPKKGFIAHVVTASIEEVQRLVFVPIQSN